MLIDVPCKIGDVVWGIRSYKGVPRAQCGFVSEMQFTKQMQLLITIKYVCLGRWGEKIFATQAECEAAIAKMK